MPDSLQISETQSAAIMHGEGPLLVIAGPGSGKTFVITRRILYLIEHHHIPPEAILVITFTKAASMEMQKRFKLLSEKSFYPVTFGTFHAVFFQILQQTYHFDYSNIITPQEKELYLQEALDICFAKESEGSYADAEPADDSSWKRLLLQEIGKVKNMGIPIENYSSLIMDEVSFRRIFTIYSGIMKGSRKLDFEDMLFLCRSLFERQPEILIKWQQKYRFILIDEFQDINSMQYEVIRQLTGKEGNIFAVGDDDQAIYGFRGSKPDFMFRFMEDFKDAGQILLDTNYRCSGNIIELSGALIGENRNRFTKKIKGYGSAGEKVIVYGFKSKEEEVENILNLVSQFSERGMLSGLALIFRTNSAAGYYAEKLSSRCIPFQLKEKIPDFYDHFIVKDLFQYLEFSKTGRRAQMYRIMNKPVRYLGRNAFRSEYVNFEEVLQYYGDKEYMRDRILRLQYDCGLLKNMDPYAAVNYIRKGIGYEEYLRKLSMEKHSDLKEWMDVLDGLQQRAAGFETFEKWQSFLTEFAEQRKQNTSNDIRGEAARLVTIHGAKGLEYETVIIPDINKGSIPHKKAVLPEELEEERRMLYVAMTRAQKRLFLFYITGTNQSIEQPSEFLKAIQLSSSSINSSCSVSERYSS